MVRENGNISVVRILPAAVLAIVLIFALAACGSNKSDDGFKGRVKIDGSSTVFPITEAVSEEFQIENPGVRITVGLSGTGGGFKKFATGETDISNASRAIKPEEAEEAEANSIEYLELTVAYDGLSVVVNPQNKFAKDITVKELKKTWTRGSKVKTWSDIRRGWPDRRVKLFGPGTDSGTFDFFTKEINGEEDVSRPDYTASEDDNTLVQGIAGEKDALGYFGFAYYAENKDKVRIVTVNGVKPTPKTIRSGQYDPLSRPLLIYVNKKSLKRRDTREYVKFYLENAGFLAEQVGYVPLPDELYKEQLAKLKLAELKKG